jgi:hypothetical protein
MSRRVVIGQMGDGTVRLRTARPGYDALTAPDDPAYISFDSNWSNIVRIHKVGVADLLNGPAVSFADLGYIPFMDVRQYVGGVIYDDYVGSVSDRSIAGYKQSITRTGFTGLPYNYWDGSTTHYFGQSIAYVVYKVPVQ